MHYEMSYGAVAAHASESARAAFIRRTYAHLAGAILAFLALEVAFFNLASAAQLEDVLQMWFRSNISILVMFGVFIGGSVLATWWASQGGSPALQYAGLGLYVLLEAVIFVPLLYMAIYWVQDRTILPTAGILTLAMFGGLTATVFLTQKDFSFLGPILAIASFIILGIIVCAILFPSSLGLGLWFSVLMVVLASGSILYQTSNVMLHYRTDQHVAAALALFAAVATLFYYVLRVLIQMRNN